MNLVGLYFFSFLICGHLLQMSIKNSRHHHRCDFPYTRNRASRLHPRAVILFYFLVGIGGLPVVSQASQHCSQVTRSQATAPPSSKGGCPLLMISAISPVVVSRALMISSPVFAIMFPPQIYFTCAMHQAIAWPLSANRSSVFPQGASLHSMSPSPVSSGVSTNS